MESMNITSDLLQHTSLIDLALEFAGSRENLKYLKFNKKKSLIGVVMPNVELICAADAIPVYGMRMLPFAKTPILKALNLGQSLFGSNKLSKIVKYLGKQSFTTNIIDEMINEVINGIFDKFDYMFHKGIENGVPSDECYGIKVIQGLYNEKFKNFDGNFFQSIRCSAFQKLYESCSLKTPTIFVDVPPYKTQEAKDLAVAEVSRVIYQLEKITGTTITNKKLREICNITNKCKQYSENIINLAMGNKYTINPVSFAKILGIIEICFQDYLSDPSKMLELLRKLYLQMDRAIKIGDNVMDVSNFPKILFTSRFGGWDYIIGDYIFQNGGRVVYADWHIYGFMTQISTSGDMVENYADYLLSMSNGFGPDNEGLVNNIMDFVVKNEFDGVIYNQLFGCHSLSTAYARLRKKLMREEIPSTLVNFNNVGENREQLKTRVVALMEIIRN